MNKILLIFLLSVLLIPACSNNTPEVQNITWELSIVEDTGESKVYEELFIYLQVQDGDGLEDIDEIYLIHDEGLKYWQLTRDTWIKGEIEGATWIGSSGITSFTTFDRGTYRYVVIDKSGDRIEDSFYLDVNKAPSKPSFPSAEVKGGTLSLQSPVPELLISVYNEDDDGIHLAEAGPGNYRLSEVIPANIQSSARYLFLYARIPQEGYILKSGPYYLDERTTSSDTSEN